MGTLTHRQTICTVSRLARLVCACVVLAAISGCASSRSNTIVTQRLQDPPQLSPYARSLTNPYPPPGGSTVRRPLSNPPADLQMPDGPLTTVMPRRPDSHSVPNSGPAYDEFLEGPLLGGPTAPRPSTGEPSAAGHDHGSSVIREPELMLTVNGPEDVRVGEQAAFEVTIRNSLSQSVEGVTVLCTLPAGFVYPGASERAFRQRIGRLEAWQSRKLDLSLLCEQAGQQCVEFEASAEGFETVTERACVACRDLSVRLDVMP